MRVIAANILAYGGLASVGVGLWLVYPPLVYIVGGAIALLLGGFCYAGKSN